LINARWYKIARYLKLPAVRYCHDGSRHVVIRRKMALGGTSSPSSLVPASSPDW
jgi:hypothetical protein